MVRSRGGDTVRDGKEAGGENNRAEWIKKKEEEARHVQKKT